MVVVRNRGRVDFPGRTSDRVDMIVVNGDVRRDRRCEYRQIQDEKPAQTSSGEIELTDWRLALVVQGQSPCLIERVLILLILLYSESIEAGRPCPARSIQGVSSRAQSEVLVRTLGFYTFMNRELAGEGRERNNIEVNRSEGAWADSTRCS